MRTIFNWLIVFLIIYALVKYVNWGSIITLDFIPKVDQSQRVHKDNEGIDGVGMLNNMRDALYDSEKLRNAAKEK